MKWPAWLAPRHLFTGRSLDQLKQAAGSPYPYRLAVSTFWWLGGIDALLLGNYHTVRAWEIPLIVGIFSAGGFFFLRLFRKGLAEVIFLYIVRPRVGFPMLGWLWFGNPFRERLPGRLLFFVSLSGLAFSLLSPQLSPRACCGA